jgi:AcrR family transcriptional regulator
MTAATAPTLRTRRKRATREALAAEAVALFTERGFDAVSVDEIAHAAGVSRRTFFRYFQTKESVFFAPQEARLAAFETALIAAGAADGPDGRAATAQLIADASLQIAARYEHDREAVLREHAVLAASTSLHAYDAQLDSRWERALRDAILRDGRDDIDATIVAGAVLGVMRAVLRGWLETGGTFDLRVRGADALARLAPLLNRPAAAAQPTHHEAP